MNPIIPTFILKQYEQQQLSGTFIGTAVFVDISGFTPLTNQLLAHGPDAAETLADLIEQLFTPLISVVTQFDGFIANFGGDAFTALFPATKQTADQLRQLPLLMQAEMSHNQIIQSAYGRFSFALKIGVAYGSINWQIITDKEKKRAIYTFHGTPIEQSVAAEKEAASGDIILDQSYQEQMTVKSQTKKKAQFWKLQSAPITHPNYINQTTTKPRAFTPNLFHFASKKIVNLKVKGEFRPIVSLFIEIPRRLDNALFHPFINDMFHLQQQFSGHFNTINISNRGRTVLFFWGTPTSYENDLSRALSFLMKLKEQTPFPITAGLTYNQAFAGFIGSQSHQDYTCLSSDVNLAARLMNAAPVGSCWFDERIYTNLPAEFTAQFVDHLHFKGFDEPQPVYQLLSQQSPPQTIESTDLFVGRQEQLRQLEQALPNNPNYQPIYLYGEAGIGKTYLIHHFLHQRPYQLLFCQVDSIQQQLLAPFIPFLADYFQFLNNDSDEIKRAQIKKQLEKIAATINDPYLKDELNRADSFLAALLNLYWPNSLYAQLDAESRLQNIFSSLKALLKAITIDQTVLIIFEDADQIDKESYTFIQQLMSNIEQYPIGLILTGRTIPTELTHPFPYPTIYLPPMSTQEVAKITSLKLNKLIAPAVHNLIQERTDGNPFFTDQLLLYLQEEQLLIEKEALWTIVDSIPRTIPTDVRSLLLARLDQLPAQTKELVQIASIFGREFNKNELLAMHTHADLTTDWAELQKKMICTPINEHQYIFQHALLRDVAYEMQLPTRRKQLHYQIATTIERLYGKENNAQFGTLAHHFQQAESNREAIYYFTKAAETAKQNYQNELALTYYNQLFSYAQSEIEQLPLQRQIGELHQLLGNWEQSDQFFTAAYQTAVAQQNETVQADIIIELGHLAELNSNYRDALTLVSQALIYYQKIDHFSGEANAFYQLGSIYWRQNEIEKADKYYQQSLSFAEKSEDQFGMSRCLNALGNISETIGEYQKALHYYNKALTIDHKLNHKPGIARVLGNMAIINRRMGNYEISVEQSNQSLLINQQLGNKQGVAITLSNLGVLYRNQKELNRAESYYKQARYLYQEMNHQTGLSIVLNNLGVVYKHQGNYDKAIHTYQQSLKIATDLGHQRSAAMRLNNIGDIYILKEEYSTALSYLEDALLMSQKINDQRGIAIKLNTIAELKFKQKLYAEAATYNAQAIELMEQNQEQDLLITALFEQAEIMAALGNKDDAYLCLQKGETLATQLTHEQQLQIGRDLTLKLNQLFASN